MKNSLRHIDQRFPALRTLANSQRPPKGWIRAIRDALGMTTAQFARRLKIAQPSAVELEQSEAANSITLRTLERAAEALGCRLVYAVIPQKPLEETVRNRAKLIAGRKLAAVEHNMRLEDQAVGGKKAQQEILNKMIEDLLQKPARLWDDA
ncbi:MAG: mobile mystery protein A [Rhizomicrobium sp.]|jgi:predicted DNA-binding mobile mystery protein A